MFMRIRMAQTFLPACFTGRGTQCEPALENFNI